MEIETIEQIIKMLGDATGTAGTVAIIWVVGGVVVSLAKAGMLFYSFIYAVRSALDYFKSPLSESAAKKLVEKRDEALLANKGLIEEKSRSEWTRNEKIDNLKAAHNMELEKIKHLYKILKESKKDE